MCKRMTKWHTKFIIANTIALKKTEGGRVEGFGGRRREVSKLRAANGDTDRLLPENSDMILFFGSTRVGRKILKN